VDDPARVRHVQRIRDLNSQAQDFGQRERLPVEVLSKRLAINKLHRDERSLFPVNVLRVSNVINRADIRMIQCRRGLRLAPESLERRHILHHVFRKEFQCDRALQPGVHCLEHHAHPASTQLLDDSKVRDGLVNHR